MKSAVELAMERAARTAGAMTELTGEQKERIAEIRKEGEAKVAQAKIMLDQRIAAVAGRAEFAAEIEQVREEFRREQALIEERTEKKIAGIRAEGR